MISPVDLIFQEGDISAYVIMIGIGAHLGQRKLKFKTAYLSEPSCPGITPHIFFCLLPFPPQVHSPIMSAPATLTVTVQDESSMVTVTITAPSQFFPLASAVASNALMEIRDSAPRTPDHRALVLNQPPGRKRRYHLTEPQEGGSGARRHLNFWGSPAERSPSPSPSPSQEAHFPSAPVRTEAFSGPNNFSFPLLPRPAFANAAAASIRTAGLQKASSDASLGRNPVTSTSVTPGPAA